ncbi:cytochrome c-type biogenesis CcmH-like mitochondrial protein [Solanum pennellii]|uniref:Cytochrome c-type biogenesis protein n=1 Tax=Solanum pennellii TaxID=28526 RepID=A0ABM1GA41_SOLPN|nr:cytochrome c-type biogenesis CcmH-like mitochondrial protein [Solanum pennellii]
MGEAFQALLPTKVELKLKCKEESNISYGQYFCIEEKANDYKLIRDEIKAGKSDKEIYTKLEDDFGETVLYAPKFDMQTAAIWLSPLLVAGAAGGLWAYKKHRQKTNVHIMALNLVRGIPLTPKEKETMLDVLTPPPGGTSSLSWWKRLLQQ